MEGGDHICPLRVYYEDTDAAGVVYYANYLKYAERARTEWLRLLGIDQSRMARDLGIVFAVRSCAVEYQAPARLDDLIEVRSRLIALKGATLDAEQEIRRNGERLVCLDTKIASVNSDGRPVRLPAAVRTAMEPYLPNAGTRIAYARTSG